jgi:hypothetical protein
MAFLTIEPTAGISAHQLRRAIDNGPPEVGIEAPHEQMLADGGFTDIETVDLTTEFSRTQQAWTDAWRMHETELSELLGPDLLEERKAERQATRSVLDEGLLRRTLYTARRPR